MISWPRTELELPPTIASVPVTIVSSVEIAAAPADNPSEEVVEDEAATAPVNVPEAPPEPTPPPPTPTPPPPVPRPATKAPAPRPAPTPAPAPKKATPTPPRPAPTPPRAAPAPARPATKSDAPPLDLDALAGPSRPSTNRGTRPATGQQGAGRAPQATGAPSTAFFNKVYSIWNPPCQTPGAVELRIQFDVTLDRNGRLTSEPRLVSPRSDPIWTAVASGAAQALVRASPFDVPEDFEGGSYRPAFNVGRACANR